jgi:hypothetical protein
MFYLYLTEKKKKKGKGDPRKRASGQTRALQESRFHRVTKGFMKGSRWRQPLVLRVLITDPLQRPIPPRALALSSFGVKQWVAVALQASRTGGGGRQ